MAIIDTMRPAGPGKLRTDRFTTLVKEPPDQFDCWKSLIAPMLDVTPGDIAMSGFVARARAYDLGKIQFASVFVDPMHYTHGLDHVDLGGIDHWCLTLVKHGSEVDRFNDDELQLSAGSLGIISLAHPFSGYSGSCESIRIFLCRDQFADIADLLDAASLRTLGGSLAHIFKEYLLAMEAMLADLSLDDLSLVVESFSHLLKASLKPIADNMVAADRAISASRFNLARKYIQTHLKSPNLDALGVCQALGISRRQLYHLFERYGGVASFIKQRRLAACCRAIADATDHRLISSIAFDYGYADPALFSRQFNAEFGFSPSEAREARISGHGPAQTSPETLPQWLLQDRGRTPG